MTERYPTFDAYWLAYLGEHSRAGTRALHYLGTVLGLFVGAAAGVLIGWWAFVVLGFFGYGIALASHPLVQRNRPFARQPLWGFVSDLRMLGLAITGRLAPHLARAAALRAVQP
jgi:hypothetical protein